MPKKEKKQGAYPKKGFVLVEVKEKTRSGIYISETAKDASYKVAYLLENGEDLKYPVGARIYTVPNAVLCRVGDSGSTKYFLSDNEIVGYEVE